MAGSGEIAVEAATVGEAIEKVTDRFGPGFAARLERSRVWLNGDEAEPSSPVGPLDEIAILPPVSGGAGPATLSAPGVATGIAGLAVLILNQTGGEAGWAALVVGLLGLWIADVAVTVADRGRIFPSGPALVSTIGAVFLTHRWGLAGVAAGLVVAIIAPMAWAVLSDSTRMLSILGPMTLVGVMAASAAGSLVIAHRLSGFGVEGIQTITAGLIAGTAAGALGSRIQSPLGDPIMAIGIVTLLGTVLAAFVFGVDVFTFTVVAAVLALAAVVGRGLGSIIRTGRTGLLESAAGLLTPLDGAVLASAIFLPVFRLFG